MNRRRAGWVALATFVFGAVTALVFLTRAGDPGPNNWPITWELRSSDNGVLFQFASDVFAGRPLDWSFSPQVFVFPEIPISLGAFAASGGSVQVYYLIVAVVNNAILFLALFALVGVLFPHEAVRSRLARAAVAALPLLLLPLVGTTWLLSYPLAPTYYFGMYVGLLLTPVFVFSPRRATRIAVGVGLALTGASNPLMFVFLAPALGVALVVLGFSLGWRAVARPAAWSAGVIVVALALRFGVFGRLQGGSPLDYIDSSVFGGRITTIGYYLSSLLSSPSTAIVVILGAVVALGALGVGVVIAIRGIRRRSLDAPRATALYLALIPVGGLIGTLVLIITDYLYLWPVLILPLVLLLLPLPTTWVRWSLPVAAIVLAVTFFLQGGTTSLAASSTYFTYRSPETQCLDAKLPEGVTVGYSTFSDARRIELTSQRGIRLVQLKSSGVRAYWLTNRDYVRDEVGRFFYLNDRGDEPAISRAYIESHFGSPDRQFSCGEGQTVIIYDDPAKIALIKARYSTLPAP